MPRSFGPNSASNDRRADRAEDVGDGVSDRHRIQQSLRLVRRQPEPIDRVGRESHRRRQRLRARKQTGGGTDIVSRDLRRDHRSREAKKAGNNREHELAGSILGDATDELRTDAVADREQEHQEEHRLDVRRDRDAELADRHRRKQRRSHCTEAKAPVTKSAEVVADGERQEQRDFGVRPERRGEPDGSMSAPICCCKFY